MLLPLLALDLHLRFVARAIDRVHFFLTNEFLSGQFAVGVVDFLEPVEGLLVAGLSRNLPVTDCDFVVAEVFVFVAADVVTRTDASSQRAYSQKQSGPFLINRYSVALVAAIRNGSASCRRTELGGPNVAIKRLEVISGCSIFTYPVTVAHQCKRNVIIFQTPCLKPAQVLLIAVGWLWFATERTSKGKLLAGGLLLVLLLYGCFVFLVASPASIEILGVYAGKRHQADSTVLGRGERSEQAGALELLLELLRQHIKPLADILRGGLLGLAGLGPLTLLAHGCRRFGGL